MEDAKESAIEHRVELLARVTEAKSICNEETQQHAPFHCLRLRRHGDMPSTTPRPKNPLTIGPGDTPAERFAKLVALTGEPPMSIGQDRTPMGSTRRRARAACTWCRRLELEMA